MVEIPEVEKYETSDKFEELNFGCLEKVAGYGKSKNICSIYAKSSSTSAFISGVIKEGLATFKLIDPKLSPLHNHFVAYNEGDRIIYLRGEIKFDSLEKGQELSEYTMKDFRPYGLPGDSVSQYVPKWLGGYDSGNNAFNLHSSVSLFL
uniref:Uncharacterized protein n=1 Tax=Panagrolaimus superbus TaxID=310955 RepID=A0A914YN78_9BILA